MPQKIEKSYEVAVIGGGAAGLSCAAWCAELGLQAVLFEQESEFGGQMLWTHNEIRNHLGATARNGREMRDIFVSQIAESSFTKHLRTAVTKVDCVSKIVETRGGDVFEVKFIVFANGIRRRKLGLDEDKFRGRGLIESGKRDGAQTVGKTAVIIGGGDAAAENALILSKFARKVYLIHRRAEFRARREFLDEISATPDKIEVITNARPTAIFGAESVEAIEITDSNAQTRRIEAEILLIRIGVEPNGELFHNQIKTDENGYVLVDSRGQTSAENVFAIGDIANPAALTISTAVGTGATCAKVMREIADRISV